MEDHYYCLTSSTKSRPKNSKSHVICAVYGCQNSYEVGLYRLPDNIKDTNRRKQWISVLRMEKVPKNAHVCGNHFDANDFITPKKLNRKGKIKRLRKTAVPSQNLPKSTIYRSPSSDKKRAIVSRKNRSARRRLLMDEIKCKPLSDIKSNENLTDADLGTNALEDIPYVEPYVEIQTSPLDPKQVDSLCNRYREVSVQVNTLDSKFNFAPTFIEFINNDAKMATCTGINTMDKFEHVCMALEYLRDAHAPSFAKKSSICLRRRAILTLMRIKLNIRFSALSVFFELSKSLTSEIFFTTIDMLHAIFKRYIYWPSKDEIRDNLPNVFRTNFAHTRVILDCTEISVQKFSCLICKTRTYSQYKCNHTVKILVGISPAGLISFVSRAFGGRTSDKFIFDESNITDLCEPGDGIMVDKGFLIEYECAIGALKLIRPPFVGKRKNLSSTESALNTAIARVRVHVERIMQRLKTFELLRSTIPLSLLECLDKIILIVCALVNLSEPILSDAHFAEEPESMPIS